MPYLRLKLPADACRVLISMNPKAGARSSLDRVERLSQLLASARLAPTIHTDLAELADEANRLYEAGHLRAVVGAGGDGTAAELVNRTLPGVPISLIPCGTENLLARHFQLGATPEACCDSLLHGNLLRLDAAQAGSRVFLLMAGVGFDADVVRRLHHARTGHITTGSYYRHIWQTIRHYEYPKLRIYWSADGLAAAGPRAESAEACWLFAFNLPCYGGGFQINPDADAADAMLDVCTYRKRGFWSGVKLAGAVLLGRQRQMTGFDVRRTAGLRIEADEEVPYQLDGDPGGVLPLDIRTLPQRLTLVVPGETPEGTK